MKPIELTKKHKSKLFKMCKKLFPEHVIYEVDINGFIEGEQWKGDQHLGEDKPYDEFNIHWFEFCMTHLSSKIDSFRKDDYLICYGQSYDNAINASHPVDYLYEEFKKLK